MFYKIQFNKELSKEEFITEIENISKALTLEHFTIWNSDLEEIELDNDGVTNYGYIPIKETIGGIVFNKDWKSKDEALRTFKTVILKASNLAKQVYINGNDQITDPNAWFEIPKIN